MKRATQIPLFDEPLPSTAADEVHDRVSHRHLHVAKSTFKGGLDTAFHRWFRLTPSYGPELVRQVLEEFGAGPHDVVLDPFSGAGTTAIECKLLGMQAYGFEINPFLHFVAQTCLQWDLNATMGETYLARLREEYRRLLSALEGKGVADCGLEIPPIHNVHRWWRADVLKEMLVIKEALKAAEIPTVWTDFFRLALAAVLVPDLTNVTLGRLQLHFIDKSSHVMRTWEVFERQCRMMLGDLAKPHGNTNKAIVFNTDATNPAISDSFKANIVITSPPYPNRYSYVWNTRPHLYMLDFFKGKSDAGMLDTKTIGGTWGTATSMLAKGQLEPENDAVREAAGPVVERIRESDGLMANYVMKYFNLIARQLAAMEPFLAPDAKIAYVVGNSCIKDVYVETDVILGRIIEGLDLGYRVDNIERFRKRHSGTDLYETTVYAAKR